MSSTSERRDGIYPLCRSISSYAYALFTNRLNPQVDQPVGDPNHTSSKSAPLAWIFRSKIIMSLASRPYGGFNLGAFHVSIHLTIHYKIYNIIFYDQTSLHHNIGTSPPLGVRVHGPLLRASRSANGVLYPDTLRGLLISER